MNECHKCGSTKKLKEIFFPHTYEDPSYTDFICSKCIDKLEISLKKFQEF